MYKFLFQTPFKTLMKTHAKQIVELLLNEGNSFSISCDITSVKFSPALPPHITSTFNEVSNFVFSGYTLESIELDEEGIHFEAGFGSENIGSFVSIAWEGVVEILIHVHDLLREIPLFTNVAHPCFYQFSQEELAEITNIQESSIERSMLALASNPENARFFKK